MAAFALAFLMVGRDLAINRADALEALTGSKESAKAWKSGLGVVEESLKLAGEMMFLFAALRCRDIAQELESEA